MALATPPAGPPGRTGYGCGSRRHFRCGSRRLALRLGLAGALALAVSPARAQGDNRGAAEALALPLEHAAPSPVTAEALTRTREALEQATRFRAAGDEAHAKAADGLAREWAETARDLALAAAAEKQADDRKRQAMQAQAQLERTRALVEDGIARLGRIHAELAAAPGKAATAVEVHDGQRQPATAASTAKGPPSASPRAARTPDADAPPAPAGGGAPGGSTP